MSKGIRGDIFMFIGITGGIGTGKSYVVKLLNTRGYKIIDSDLITRKLLVKEGINYKLVVAEFGNSILDAEVEINRGKLKKMILEDESKRKKLNSLTHVNIMKIIKLEGEEYLKIPKNKGVVFVELPLLYEENLESFFDDVWLVDSSLETQIKRIVLRDRFSVAEALKIIEKQLSREEKLKRCGKIIDNDNGDKKYLELQIDNLLQEAGLNGK